MANGEAAGSVGVQTMGRIEQGNTGMLDFSAERVVGISPVRPLPVRAKIPSTVIWYFVVMVSCLFD